VEVKRSRWTELRPSTEQLAREIDFINEALIPDEAHYLATPRAGRGFAFRGGERSMMWALYREVTDALRAGGRRPWSAIPREICLATDRADRLERSRHILVDEAQFFAPSWFQVVKLALERDGHLFMCADPNQGFLRRGVSWKRVGLEVAGRTKTLRRSYRNTRAILQAGAGVLAQLACEDVEEYLSPDFSLMDPGEPPVLVYTDSPQDSVDRAVNELIERARASTPLAAMLVVYGDNVPRRTLYEKLTAQLGSQAVWWLNKPDQKKRPPPGTHDHLRMAYVDTATGLEAANVILLGVEDLLADWAPTPHPLPAREEGPENTRKLYMALTRAGQRLVLLSSRRLPAPIERLFQVSG
jgi:superfamily I DNA/RNA helicase